MPIPPGTEAPIAWCLVWAVFALGILTACSQLANDTSLAPRVDRRTLNRLGDLNSFLNHQIDVQWRSSTTTDIIPDLASLVALKSQVDRAAAPDAWLSRRHTLLEVSRALAGVELVAALIMLALIASQSDPASLQIPAVVIAGSGMGVSVLAMVSSLALGLAISKGPDYL